MATVLRRINSNTVQLGRSSAALDLIDHLPARIYTIRTEKDGVYLDVRADRFPCEAEKYYGDVEDFTRMLLAEYQKSPHGFGALLYGKKGCGKTLQAEHFCNKAIEAGFPVITITPEAIQSPALISAIAHDLGNCVFYFDEFGKSYPEESSGEKATQDEFLALFSSTLLNHVGFILTENDATYISKNIIHRPGRLKFSRYYGGFGKDTLNEIIGDRPVVQAVRDILEIYYNFHTDQIDALTLCADAAVNAMSLDEFFTRIKHYNIMKPKLPCLNIEQDQGFPFDGQVIFGATVDTTFIYKDGVSAAIPQSAIDELTALLKSTTAGQGLGLKGVDSDYSLDWREQLRVEFKVFDYWFSLTVDEFRPYGQDNSEMGKDHVAKINYPVFRQLIRKHGTRPDVILNRELNKSKAQAHGVTGHFASEESGSAFSTSMSVGRGFSTLEVTPEYLEALNNAIGGEAESD